MFAARHLGPMQAVAVHTLYEMVEGNLFPREHRDVSMLNHVGDSIAFVAGYFLANR